MPDDGMKVWASMGQTINMGNYESIKIEIGVTGIPIDASPEFIQQQLTAAESTIDRVVHSLAEELVKKVTDLGRGPPR